MGVWGTAIFSDDDASDIRSAYRDLIGDGYGGPAATDKILSSWKDDIDNPVLWLALAATQWTCGRLEARVKAKALQIIEDGSDLRRWMEENPSLASKRRAALVKLGERLRSPQPEEKRIRKRFRATCDWGLGEVIAYQLKSGKWALFQVVGYHSDKGGTYPTCYVLDWEGEEIPTLKEIERLAVRPGRTVAKTLTIGAVHSRELPHTRIRRTGSKKDVPKQLTATGGLVVLWRRLDIVLNQEYGLN